MLRQLIMITHVRQQQQQAGGEGDGWIGWRCLPSRCTGVCSMDRLGITGERGGIRNNDVPATGYWLLVALDILRQCNNIISYLTSILCPPISRSSYHLHVLRFEWLETNGPKSKSKSMLIDQLCVQPPLLFVMFVFLDMTKAAVREVQPSCARTLSTIGPTIVSSWRFWPLAVWATFKYLKKKHYTVALNLCSIAWTVYLSKGKKQ
mmetsp:Transcript_11807/g.24334  ORF Transcript_11807/g.24334 Transcript_11807/m.24334 type:complete len:206 (+) Transcript_11807:511-1128(+)